MFQTQKNQFTYQQLDGKESEFFILNVDIHNHSRLIDTHKAFAVAEFYRCTHAFFRLAVEAHNGVAAPWQGDGGFAVFSASDEDAYKQVWGAAEDFLCHYQPLILRNVLCRVKEEQHKEWKDHYPSFYALIDRVEMIFDYRNPGIWCGQNLSETLKQFKHNAEPRHLVLTPAAHTHFPQAHWRSLNMALPKKNEPYKTVSFGSTLIADPTYRERIQRQQKLAISARNGLTESVIRERSLTTQPHRLILAAVLACARVFEGRPDIAKGSFRASVWKSSGTSMSFFLGYPSSDESCFTTPHLSNNNTFAMGEGCIGHVWKEGHALVEDDIQSPKFFTPKHKTHKDVSLAAFPILPYWRIDENSAYDDTRLLGVLCLGVDTRSSFRFTSGDLEYMEEIVGQFTLNMALGLTLMQEAHQPDQSQGKNAKNNTTHYKRKA